MTEFYRISGTIYQQYDSDRPIFRSHYLYSTFDKACDALEKEIKEFVDSHNEQETEAHRQIVFEKPNRQEKLDDLMIDRWGRFYVVYYETLRDHVFEIERFVLKE